MPCWHFKLRRKLLPYIEGQLPEKDVKRLERHLLDCAPCRELLLRLRTGHQIAQAFRRHTARSDQFFEFESMMGGMKVTSGSEAWRGWGWQRLLERWATPRVLGALTVVLIAQLVLLVASNRRFLFGQHAAAPGRSQTLDLNDFHLLKIADLKFNTEPHIATEGYVADVHTDAEEGTVAFRLVQSPATLRAFVVCEIMSPIKIAPPREGSYVRVYGVSRYDAQTDRKWYEVNPVLNIAVLKR
jgi:hypothetical protein